MGEDLQLQSPLCHLMLCLLMLLVSELHTSCATAMHTVCHLHNIGIGLMRLGHPSAPTSLHVCVSKVVALGSWLVQEV